MPLLGAHMSIAGGLYKAFERLKQIRGEALQIFLYNQRQWDPPVLKESDIEMFRAAWEKAGPIPVAAHNSYLINLASPDTKVREMSIWAFSEELRRAYRLGIKYLIAHPGNHCGLGIRTGLERFVLGLDEAISKAEPEGLMVLLETTSGQGTSLGGSPEEIQFILERSNFSKMLGVCLDTCHLFAAGWNFADEQGYASAMDAMDRAFGLKHVKWLHLNDSKTELGSRVDRHQHIGKGHIGINGFRLLLNDERFRSHPMVLETPKGKNLKDDCRNLKVLRRLLTS